MINDQVAAVVVCFNPPEGLEQRLACIAAQVDVLIVWDNGSDIAVEIPADLPSEKSVLMRSESNLGIAAAQNRALNRATQLGARYSVLFDHDSIPDKDMVAVLHAELKAADDKTAVAVPRIRYALADIKCRWPQAQASGWSFKFVYADSILAPTVVDLAISSGMLLDLAVWKKLGGFDQSLFIDLVDTEYCLLLRKHGYQLIACAQAQLQHSLGDVDRKHIAGVKMYPTHHSVLRHFYINRNRWVLTGRYGLRFPAWLAYEWLGAAKLFLKTVLFEPQRGPKLYSMLKGNILGLKLLFTRAPAERYDGQ
ncbi:MAG: glycosyltransferase family 2 protein [Oceanococcus sp.]